MIWEQENYEIFTFSAQLSSLCKRPFSLICIYKQMDKIQWEGFIYHCWHINWVYMLSQLRQTLSSRNKNFSMMYVYKLSGMYMRQLAVTQKCTKDLYSTLKNPPLFLLSIKTKWRISFKKQINSHSKQYLKHGYVTSKSIPHFLPN